MATLKLADIYIGTCRSRFPNRAFVYGVQFGPMLLAVTGSDEEACSEWDERFGRRVDPVADAADLADYKGATVGEQIENAMDAGDIRCNDGGSLVWVDHYEWCHEFDTVADAGRFFREGATR